MPDTFCLNMLEDDSSPLCFLDCAGDGVSQASAGKPEMTAENLINFILEGSKTTLRERRVAETHTDTPALHLGPYSCHTNEEDQQGETFCFVSVFGSFHWRVLMLVNAKMLLNSPEAVPPNFAQNHIWQQFNYSIEFNMSVIFWSVFKIHFDDLNLQTP